MTRVLNFADGFSTDTVPGITSTITTVSGPIYQDNVSGSNVVLTSIAYSVIRLINGGLVSIDTIPAGSEGQMITVINATGVDITISNNTGTTAANRILTGQKASIVLKDEASIILEYDTNELRWMVIGGTGSGSSSSSNYATNSDAEAGTTGYTTYNDNTGVPANDVNPGDASGGSASITFTATSSIPLFGTKSFLLSKGATNRQGDGVAYAYTLSAGDATKVLTLTMPYATTANYVDGDIRVGIYDVTNAQIIEGTQRDLAANANGFYVSSFQMPSNSTSFRIFWHVSSTNASAYDIKFDNVILEKKPVVKGPVVTDWISYTPTLSDVGTATYTSLAGKYRRVGDSCEFAINVFINAAGSGTTTNVGFLLPQTVDTTKLADSGANVMKIGSCTASDGTNTEADCGAIYATPTTFILLDVATNQGIRGADLIASSRWRITGSFPVVGWSSNVVLSEDTGNRVVAFSASLSGSQTIAPNNSDIKININQIGYDKTGSFDTSNYRYVIPESGVYTFTGTISLSSTNVLSDRYRLRLFKNGTFFINGQDDLRAAGISFIMQSTWTYEFSKGDYVEMYFYGNGNNSVSTLTVTSTATALNGYKIQTPQSIGQSEVVGATYKSGTASVLTSNSVIPYGTKEFDTHNAFNSSIWTCPVAGKYSISVSINLTITLSTGNNFRIEVQKNTVQNFYAFFRTQTSVSPGGTGSLSTAATKVIDLVKGDAIRFVYLGDATGTLTGSAVGNFFSIIKVG